MVTLIRWWSNLDDIERLLLFIILFLALSFSYVVFQGSYYHSGRRYEIWIGEDYYYCDEYSLAANHLNLYDCGWLGYDESVRNPVNIRILE